MIKLVGFYISENKEDFPGFDLFRAGLNSCSIVAGTLKLQIWGIGDIRSFCAGKTQFCFSFPYNNDLLDKNVVITLNKDSIVIENDWLGSIPVYYNCKERLVSTLPNLCSRSKVVHEEGLTNFLEFGYSVFEQTIFRDVKFLRYYSKCEVDAEGVRVLYKEDPVKDVAIFDKATTPDEVISNLLSYCKQGEASSSGDIVIPTSGGYDSRILNHLIQNKERIRSFTYGITKNQQKSSEVVYAAELSNILKTSWEVIELNKFHNFIPDWYKLYGFSTHLHGMYHIDFYQKIKQRQPGNGGTFLSGIVGDAWAGSINKMSIVNEGDLVKLGYNHGVGFNLNNACNKMSFNTCRSQFYDENANFLNDERFQVVTIIRLKIILLSYLIILPEYFGFPVWTPFLNFNIVVSMLRLPARFRKHRMWQQDYFKSIGLDLESLSLRFARLNTLDYNDAISCQLDPLNTSRLKFYIDEKRLLEINAVLAEGSFYRSKSYSTLYNLGLFSVLSKFGFKETFLDALSEYVVLKPVELSIGGN